MRLMLLTVLVMVCCVPAWGQIEVVTPGTKFTSNKEIRKTIATRVGRLLSAQRPDGSWFISQSKLDVYKVGTTGLCVLALQHCHPHLEGPLAMRTREATQKGIGYIKKSPFECRTYSAALAICALYRDSPKRHLRHISTYAKMLAGSQSPGGRYVGMWSYLLVPPRGFPTSGVVTKTVREWGDNSNTQMAILGLYYAYRAGVSIPSVVLSNTRKHYQRTQHDDGGWGYKDDVLPLSYESMTVAGVITLNLTNELIHAPLQKGCRPMPVDKVVEKGFKWLDTNLNYKFVDLYGLYTIERLGILMGERELHGKDWYRIGAGRLLNSKEWPVKLVKDKNSVAGTAFGLLFLARGLEPVIIHKLRWKGNDWDNAHYAVKHITEYVSDSFQSPKQWRHVDLNASQKVLNSVSILHLNGKKALLFSAEEVRKLKDYVNGGGTIFAASCIGGAAFESSFRELMQTLFPNNPLERLADNHQVFRTPKSIKRKLVVEAVTVKKNGQTRCAVFLLPRGICGAWNRWRKTDQWAFDLGANVYFYVDRTGKRRVARAGGPTD